MNLNLKYLLVLTLILPSSLLGSLRLSITKLVYTTPVQKKICSECGAKIEDPNQKYCVSCGTEI
ncbi:MAG: zinc-ribbon domain-containing protein [Promethearchaeota archaeon]